MPKYHHPASSRHNARLPWALGPLLGVLLLLGALSCGSEDDFVGKIHGVEAMEQAAYVSTSRVWPRTRLRVCFNFDGFDVQKGWVRQAIESSYERVSGLDFFGWDRCPSASPYVADIKISHGTDGLWSYIGTDSANYCPSMQLNFDKNNWAGVVNVALHEFSHAVGFYHEFDRPDHPTDPSDARVHDDGAIIGEYDLTSASLITYNGQAGLTLSKTDVSALRLFYCSDPSYPGGTVIWDAFHYSTNTTNNASRYTTNQPLTLEAGDTLVAGTCGVPYGLAKGDTFMRLYSNGSQLTANDDACGFGSQIAFQAASRMQVEIRAGCYGNSACEGIVSYYVQPHEDATAAGATAYYALGDSHHYIYRDVRGHIREWWAMPPSWVWSLSDLTSATDAPLAASDPVGWAFGNSQHIAYRGEDNQIYEMFWPHCNGWQFLDLTASSQAPEARGKPSAFVHGPSQNVTYRDPAGHIQLLRWQATNGWTAYDLTARTGARTAVGDPVGYSTGYDIHIAFAASNGRVYELYWDPNHPWVPRLLQ